MKEIYEKQAKICQEKGEKMQEIRLLFSLKEEFDQRRYNIPSSNEVCAIMVCDANDDIPLARIVVYPKGEKNLKEIYPLDKCVEPMCYPILYPNGSYGKLFQQWVVDQAAKIEWDRLEYIKNHQTELYSSSYTNVEDFLKKKSLKSGAEIQKKIILPSTFTGGPRNMHEHFMDAMAIVNETGKPDLFVTFTCNPNDPDILKCLFPGQNPSDRPDIVTRVFNLKKRYLLELILNKQIFGEVIGYCWVVEYQKRGLPHVHLLLTLAQKDKWRNSTDIDKFIKAEIPDKKTDIELFEIVTNFMLHGPCLETSLCWDKLKRKCRKKFPKPFREITEINEDGYPLYKRPDNNRFVFKKGQKLTNQYVVPYNPFLLKTFRAHINVERVSDILVVKYLYDYIYKGYDAATIECISVGEDGEKKILNYDEVGTYLEARYLSPCEACWRIFKFKMQGKSHSVDKLDIHLENEQKIFYKKNASKVEIEEASNKCSTLTAYFKFCQENPNLKFKYIEMPKFCTWVKKDRKWKYPRQGNMNKIGRLIPINPTDTEKYYLRYLLLKVHGKNFKDLKTVNGIIYETFAEACLIRGLAQDDEEWHKCLEEASFFSRKYPKGLRTLFVNILLHCGPKKPAKLWESFKENMTADIKRKYPNYSKDQLNNMGLMLIEQSLKYHDKSLSNYPDMPIIRNLDINIDEDDLIDPVEELEKANKLISVLNKGQKEIIDKFLNIIQEKDKEKCVFIDGPGGTGKSFVLKVIFYLTRSFNKKICNMAFSGVAATQLLKGRTLHNRFKLPLNISKNSTSGIEINSKESEEIKNTEIFVWDEAPMASRFVIDIIDKKLKEIMCNNLPFGGKIFILSGDFRQCLPIKEFGTQTEIIDMIIKKSILWKNFCQMKLTENMRVYKNEKEFANELINIGDGKAGKNGFITVPEFCISKGDLIEEIFGEVLKENNLEQLQNYAILSPYNTIVDSYNEEIINKFSGEKITYFSIDETDPNSNLPITPEILNSLRCSNFPNHSISLKRNTMIMLLRNLNIKEGLCNGTRLQVTDLGKNVLTCKIKSGEKIGETTFIPRVTLIEDKKFPFLLRRHQFPIKLAFAFTINKSQSQTFEKIGVDYCEEPFTHGQTYVSLSRVKSWEGLKIKILDENDKKIKNIVWKEVLR
uniref:ATP-dependent DNA helicase n=1 Tax=Meloidogyne enterolobii TaxID=390850 RepID=A0A6V7WKA8_MELEN|nr:unnamed protein product [Meloidogyne enterolobii]